MMLLATMDHEGTKTRKSRRLKRRIYLNKGPNYMWHADGYDKLKPYGISIHGCIDGYFEFLCIILCHINSDILVKYFGLR